MHARSVTAACAEIIMVSACAKVVIVNEQWTDPRPSVQCEGSEIVEVVVAKDVRKRSRENTIEEKRRMRNFRKKRKKNEVTS